MAEGGKSIPELYKDGMREVNKVISQGNADQREIALQTLDDLTALMLAYNLESAQGRTALLRGLIDELNQVIEEVDVNPPYLGALETLTTIVDGAAERLSVEKKKLLPPDA